MGPGCGGSTRVHLVNARFELFALILCAALAVAASGLGAWRAATTDRLRADGPTGRWRSDLALALGGLVLACLAMAAVSAALAPAVGPGAVPLAVLAAGWPMASLAARGGAWKLGVVVVEVAVAAGLAFAWPGAPVHALAFAAFFPVLLALVALVDPSVAGRTPFAGGGGPR